MLPSALNIVWPMHIQRLKLPHQKVKEEMHLQENILFDFRPLVTRNIAQYPIHHMTYLATKFEVATSNGLGGDTKQEPWQVHDLAA